VFDGSKRNPQDITIAKNALKRMKTLRHPNFLKFLDRYVIRSRDLAWNMHSGDATLRL
jgi:hypothetical protein